MDMGNLNFIYNDALFIGLNKHLSKRKISCIETDTNDAHRTNLYIEKALERKRYDAELQDEINKLHQEKAHQCSICLNTLCTNDRIAITSCSHQFHDRCLDSKIQVIGIYGGKTIYSRAKPCPYCRSEIEDVTYRESFILRACRDDDLAALKAAYNDDPMITRKKYKTTNGLSHFLMTIADQNGSEQIVNFLAESEIYNIKSNVVDALPLVASLEGNIFILETMIDIDSDFIFNKYQSSKDNNFYSLIEIALREKNYILIKLLIENGVNIYNNGITLQTKDALFNCAKEYRINLLECLLINSSGHDVFNLEDSSGYTLLQLLIINSMNGVDQGEDIAKLLLEHDVNVNHSLSKKGSSLQMAIGQGKTKVVEFLLKNGADVDASTTAICYTPLQLALLNHKSEIAKCLIEHGANVELQHNNLKKAPLQIAVQYGMTDTVKLLLTKGADVNVSTSVTNKTPLELAKIGHRSEIAELLIKHGADNKSSGKS
ncbi:MAG: ankyrin repeat domain-containing protein [Endozoicomonadaceae bacterium]|nr:ankyrin repeat domain-containing protein [Endozoicomonadaceae bacterium]